VPARLGSYDILEEVTAGGMGVVYKACHQAQGTVVALKTMLREMASNPEQARRFHNEILAAARLHHDNIVPILDVGWHDGTPFYTMPFRTGGTLGKVLPTADRKALIALMEKVARGVHHAHEQNVLHRDLKPANVLLDEEGEPAVADFGLAKLHDTDLELTQTGTVLGTRPYMSPEQAAGRTRDLGPATDVWALGVMLYELLAGRRPFLGDTDYEIRDQIMHQQPPGLRKLRPDVPAELDAIVRRCLQKKPARRYASAAALADDLRRWQEAKQPPPRWPGKRALLLLALLGLAASGLGTAFWLMSEPAAQQQEQVLPAPLVLIGPTGPPKEMRWIAGEKDATVLSLQARQPFAVQSRVVSFLELLPQSPWPHVRLEAEVQHWDSESGANGIYFGHLTYETRRGTQHGCCALTFAEEGAFTRQRTLSAMRFVETGTGSWHEEPAPGSRRIFSRSQAARGVRVWRKVAIEVTDAGASAFWGPEQERFATFPAAKVQLAYARLFQDYPEAAAVYYPQGGLGLVLNRGSGSFRNVILRPLP
jgi:serine/threonine-protein kinase